METRFTTRIAIAVAVILQMGCASLLPNGKQIVESPWSQYTEAKDAYDKIMVGKTTEQELKDLGYDVQSAPNLKILNYLDIAEMVQGIPVEDLDPGLHACLRARSDCRAYVFEPKRTYSDRTGNFWLDMLNFRRQTHETGWRFKALIVFVNSHVTYKLSSGDPQINEFREQHNPLGPFQDPAGLVYKAIP